MSESNKELHHDGAPKSMRPFPPLGRSRTYCKAALQQGRRFQNPFHTLHKDKYEPNCQSKAPGDPAVEAICHLAGEQLLGGASSDPDRSIRKGHSQRDNPQACRCDWTSTSRKPAYFMPVFCSSDIRSHKTAISIAMNPV